MPVRKKLNIKCREFQIILQMVAMEIKLTITMTYLQFWKRELCTTESLRNRFFDSNRQRKTPTVIHYLMSSPKGSRPRCGPRHPILHSDIFFYVKLFATIISS